MEDTGGILGGGLSGRYGDSLNSREEQKDYRLAGRTVPAAVEMWVQDEAKRVYSR